MIVMHLFTAMLAWNKPNSELKCVDIFKNRLTHAMTVILLLITWQMCNSYKVRLIQEWAAENEK